MTGMLFLSIRALKKALKRLLILQQLPDEVIGSLFRWIKKRKNVYSECGIVEKFVTKRLWVCAGEAECSQGKCRGIARNYSTQTAGQSKSSSFLWGESTMNLL